MALTNEQERKFWLAFDQHFKFEAGKNGLGAHYGALGGYNAPGNVWFDAISDGGLASFEEYVSEHRATIELLADAQQSFFEDHFEGEAAAIVSAFQDFAFGVLASPTAPNRGLEPVHTMNGGRFAQDYLSWQGYIEALLVIRPGDSFWSELRWINGMAWELQARAAPMEVFPNNNQPLPDEVTKRVTDKWQDRSGAEIADEFRNYLDRTRTWDKERAELP